MERFIKVYHEWCKENKVLSRYQAYGHPWLYTDMIDGFMVPDIPEGDQWLYNAGWSLADIDEILRRHLGHMDFGVYAQVVEGGTVRRGDAARVL